MKKRILIIMLLCSAFLSACKKNGEREANAFDEKTKEMNFMDYDERISEQSEIEKQIEKWYDLPLDEKAREEAKSDCIEKMELIRELCLSFYGEGRYPDTLPDNIIWQALEKIAESGNCVTSSEPYANMQHYEKFEEFLDSSGLGKHGSMIVYTVHFNGSISREKYIYDGNDMYIVKANALWNDDNKSITTYISNTRIKEWRYTEKGWFCYKLCVPEYPEVTEVVDGSCLIRVKPITDENRKMSKQCVFGVDYQGNNLLCSNWDTEHMADLDYNGMYEYFHEMKYGEKFQTEENQEGIPKEQFENLIMEYLPITEEEIQKYAVFDEENQSYVWERIGCFNYAPTFFGTSVPEVTHIRENEDGTVTLTVDAVCQMILCDDAVITHELTVQFAEDGSFRYLGNKVLNNGILHIPVYQYRINKER